MPILQYKCPECGKEFEELVKKFDEEVKCPACGKTALRCYSGRMYSSTGAHQNKCSGNCKTCGGCH